MKWSLFLIIAVIAFSTANAQTGAKGLALNTKAPNFSAVDQDGKKVELNSLLKQGSVVVLFYRGYWCPYCSRQLSALNDSLQFIKAKGAQVIAITPEAEEGIAKTVEKTKASFPILYDKDIQISKAYDVSFQVEEETRTKYKDKWNIDLLQNNKQQDAAYLPIPAVYIIDKSGKITYKFFDSDYTKRPSVKELLNNLK